MNHEQQEAIKTIITSLLDKMDIRGEVEVAGGEETTVFNIRTDDSGILIGQHGANLASLQYLVRVLAHKKLQETGPFIVDVEGYKKNREDFLRELARQAAARVQETGEALFLKPMTSYERRVIHTELSGHVDIETASQGEEPERRVLIRPKKAEDSP